MRASAHLRLDLGLGQHFVVGQYREFRPRRLSDTGNPSVSIPSLIDFSADVVGDQDNSARCKLIDDRCMTSATEMGV